MELFSYLLEVSACLVLFFAFYLLVLSKLTFFKFNRFYLLATLLLSFVIPSIQFTIEREIVQGPIVNEEAVILVNELQALEVPLYATPTENQIETVEEINGLAFLPYAYALIAAIILSIGIRKLMVLLQYTKQKAQSVNGLKLLSKADGFTNCSFFNYVFIDENSLSTSEIEVLLQHEKVHAEQYHSIDKILMMFVKAVLWFNPIIYLLDRALEQAHEYEADEVTSKAFGNHSYAGLLLKLAVGESQSTLIHNFVKSPVKERIKMLFNSKSKNMKKLAYLLVVPVVLGLIWGFTVEVVEVSVRKEKVLEDKAVNLLTEKTGKELWSKTITGKVKTIVHTEVGEVLNFRYDRGIIRVFNPVKGKIKIGDELTMKVGGIVQNIILSDAKGNVMKELDAPCMTASIIKSAKGELLYELKNQDKPFISKTAFLKGSDYREERITLNTYSGKILSTTVVFSGQANKSAKIYIYVNGKLFNEQESLKFDKNFISKLSTNRGFSFANNFDIPEIKDKNGSVVFWFGKEPNLSVAMAKSRKYAQSYNGKTIEGEVVDITFSPTKVMSGFVINTGKEILNANVEAKFAEQIIKMINKGDKVSLKIYNANYWDKISSPVLTSYKLSKNGKVLFDRYPKAASLRLDSHVNPSRNKNNEEKVFGGYEGIALTKKDEQVELISGPAKEGDLEFSKDVNLAKMRYQASDSVTVNKIFETVLLYGKAKLDMEKYVALGKVIHLDRLNKRVTVYFGSLNDGNNLKIEAEVIEIDLVDNSYKTKNYFK